MIYSQNNIEQLFRLIGSFPHQQYGLSAHFEFIQTTDSAWPNQLINLNASDNEADLVLDQMENDSEKGAIPDLLMLNPTSKNDSIIDQLRKRGYKSTKWAAMTHDLESIAPQNTTSRFHVKVMQNKSDFREWLRIVEAELMASHSLNAAVFSLLLEDNNCYFFLGFEGKQPVATSFLYVKEKGAGV